MRSVLIVADPTPAIPCVSDTDSYSFAGGVNHEDRVIDPHGGPLVDDAEARERMVFDPDVDLSPHHGAEPVG